MQRDLQSADGMDFDMVFQQESQTSQDRDAQQADVSTGHPEETTDLPKASIKRAENAGDGEDSPPDQQPRQSTDNDVPGVSALTDPSYQRTSAHDAAEHRRLENTDHDVQKTAERASRSTDGNQERPVPSHSTAESRSEGHQTMPSALSPDTPQEDVAGRAQARGAQLAAGEVAVNDDKGTGIQPGDAPARKAMTHDGDVRVLSRDKEALSSAREGSIARTVALTGTAAHASASPLEYAKIASALPHGTLPSSSNVPTSEDAPRMREQSKSVGQSAFHHGLASIPKHGNTQRQSTVLSTSLQINVSKADGSAADKTVNSSAEHQKTETPQRRAAFLSPSGHGRTDQISPPTPASPHRPENIKQEGQRVHSDPVPKTRTSSPLGTPTITLSNAPAEWVSGAASNTGRSELAPRAAFHQDLAVQLAYRIPAVPSAGANAPATAGVLQMHPAQTGQARVDLGGDLIETRLGDIQTSASPRDILTPAANTIPSRSDLPQMIARQLAESASKSQNRPVEISLNPQELGRVRMSLHMSEAGITVALVTERPETLDLMRRHIDQLGQEFQAMGYEDVSFTFTDSEQNAGSSEEPTSGDQRTTMFDTDPAEPIRLHLRAGPAAGLDLRL